mmetsp:Transcript_26940/g.48461  ORF Transcript_26940/g.48461 Transcript_26940/m.48461 type:complete len:232 (-) Transcript_26940:644-1339(-)
MSWKSRMLPRPRRTSTMLFARFLLSAFTMMRNVVTVRSVSTMHLTVKVFLISGLAPSCVNTPVTIATANSGFSFNKNMVLLGFSTKETFLNEVWRARLLGSSTPSEHRVAGTSSCTGSAGVNSITAVRISSAFTDNFDWPRSSSQASVSNPGLNHSCSATCSSVHRLAGSTTSSFRIRSCAPSGKKGFISYWAALIFWNTVDFSVSRKGSDPASITYRMTPHDHTSAMNPL